MKIFFKLNSQSFVKVYQKNVTVPRGNFYQASIYLLKQVERRTMHHWGSNRPVVNGLWSPLSPLVASRPPLPQSQIIHCQWAQTVELVTAINQKAVLYVILSAENVANIYFTPKTKFITRKQALYSLRSESNKISSGEQPQINSVRFCVIKHLGDFEPKN